MTADTLVARHDGGAITLERGAIPIDALWILRILPTKPGTYRWTGDAWERSLTGVVVDFTTTPNP